MFLRCLYSKLLWTITGIQNQNILWKANMVQVGKNHFSTSWKLFGSYAYVTLTIIACKIFSSKLTPEQRYQYIRPISAKINHEAILNRSLLGLLLFPVNRIELNSGSPVTGVTFHFFNLASYYHRLISKILLRNRGSKL